MRVVPFFLLLAACPGATDKDGAPGDDTGRPTETGPTDDTGSTTDEVDGDGDGSFLPDDCDDADPAVHPGADERCNGSDDDCDGATDEDPVDGGTWYPDADRDGYGDASGAVQACEQPPSTSADGTDCDDTDPDASPAGTELGCTGVDEDCDGLYDEGFDDAAGAIRDGRAYATLAAALRDAGDGDTVWICPGVYDAEALPLSTPNGAAITLASSARDASRTVLDGEDLTHMLVHSGDLTLRDLTFRGGRAADREGGAVWVNGDLYVERCVFEGNSAYTGGGAIAWGWGEVVEITDTRFADNYAYDGGGALLVDTSRHWPDWSVSIVDSTFEGNSTTGQGGAIAFDTMGTWTLSVSGSAFVDNTSGSDGAAVARVGAASTDTGTVELTDSRFAGNTPDAATAVKLWADHLDARLTDVTFTGTRSPRGPALLSLAGDGTWTLTRAAFTRSVAGDDGAIVSATGSGSTLVAEDCDWGEGADANEGIDLVSQCGTRDLGASESFTCTGDGVWTE